MTIHHFSQLPLPPAQLANLESLGYRQLTPIQTEVLPAAMKGGDVIAQAKTGSGKTAAFSLPLVHKLDLREAGSQALVLCPTRELSIQVAGEIRKFARVHKNVQVALLYGGQAFSLQKAALQNGAHIVVGTPGRIKDHLSRGTLALGGLRTLVLDEADRMLEMGFLPDITEIIATTPPSRQTILCSATFPENIQALSAQFQHRPAHLRAGDGSSPPEIDHQFIHCSQSEKLQGTAALLSHFQPRAALIFCNTKAATDEVCRHLQGQRISSAALHGDLEQREREQILTRFRHGSCRVLVATDVAARGLDILDLPLVLNFDVPQDPDAYVHRTGRTGRAGKAGLALTLACPVDQWRTKAIQDGRKEKIPTGSLDQFKGSGLVALPSEQVTLAIAGGRRDKLRAGDILGALTGETGIDGKAVGKIDVVDYAAYVSVERKSATQALARLGDHKIKGRKFRVRILD